MCIGLSKSGPNHHLHRAGNHSKQSPFLIPGIQCKNQVHVVFKKPYSASAKSQSSLLGLTPNKFLDFLKENKIRRCFIVYNRNEQKLVASHEELQEFADFFSQDMTIDGDFKEHEGIFLGVGLRTESLLGAFLWRTCRGQAVSWIN